MVTAVLGVTVEVEEVMVEVGMVVEDMVVEVVMGAVVVVAEVVVVAALAVDEVALLAEAVKFVIRVAICKKKVQPQDVKSGYMLSIAGC